MLLEVESALFGHPGGRWCKMLLATKLKASRHTSEYLSRRSVTICGGTGR